MLCRLGQEAVQELVQKTADVFKTLKDLQVSKDSDIIQGYSDEWVMGINWDLFSPINPPPDKWGLIIVTQCMFPFMDNDK